jgi:hypothetical protein
MKGVDGPTPASPSTPDPEFTVKKLISKFPIHDVDSVRVLQDTGHLDWQRDPEDLYREITTGERRDPPTQNERDRERLIAAGRALLEDLGCPLCGARGDEPCRNIYGHAVTYMHTGRYLKGVGDLARKIVRNLHR